MTKTRTRRAGSKPAPTGDERSLSIEREPELSQEEVFDRMAPGWYSRRHWTIFRKELEELAGRWKGGRLLNIGCGHGADFLPFCKGFELHGLDFSDGMLRYAMKYKQKFGFEAELVRGDAGALPYKDGTFDWAIAVASYHHLRPAEARRNAFVELRRVLRPGGEAFVTVWNRWQPAFWSKQKETYVTWRTKEAELRRYYYLFSRSEVERMARGAGLSVVRSFAESGYRFPVLQFSKNVCLIVAKTN